MKAAAARAICEDKATTQHNTLRGTNMGKINGT